MFGRNERTVSGRRHRSKRGTDSRVLCEILPFQLLFGVSIQDDGQASEELPEIDVAIVVCIDHPENVFTKALCSSEREQSSIQLLNVIGAHAAIGVARAEAAVPLQDVLLREARQGTEIRQFFGREASSWGRGVARSATQLLTHSAYQRKGWMRVTCLGEREQNVLIDGNPLGHRNDITATELAQEQLKPLRTESGASKISQKAEHTFASFVFLDSRPKDDGCWAYGVVAVPQSRVTQSLEFGYLLAFEPDRCRKRGQADI